MITLAIKISCFTLIAPLKEILAGSYAWDRKDRTNYIKEVYETIVAKRFSTEIPLSDTLVFAAFEVSFLWITSAKLASPNKVSQC